MFFHHFIGTAHVPGSGLAVHGLRSLRRFDEVGTHIEAGYFSSHKVISPSVSAALSRFRGIYVDGVVSYANGKIPAPALVAQTGCNQVLGDRDGSR